MQILPRMLGISVLCSCLLVLFNSCIRPVVEQPKPSEITKSDREAIGDRISLAIRSDNENFPILPKIAPYDTTIYWFVQKLYDQATNTMRLDLLSPSSNRWNSNRSWKVYIINRGDIRQAFVLPGGELYISTGFLKSLEREHELYYLLAFEANIIQNKYLLLHLVDQFNSLNLMNYAEHAFAEGGLTTEELVAEVEAASFSADITIELDEWTVQTICETSVYEPTGIFDIIQNTNSGQFDWLSKRKNYSNRATRVGELIEENGDCGDFRTNGMYQQYVLDLLQ